MGSSGWTKERAQLYIGIAGAAIVAFFVVIAVAMGGHGERSAATAPTSSYTPAPPPTFSDALITTTVIDTCHQAVQKALKDPDSARFGDDWKAWQVTAPGSTPPAGMEYSPFHNDQYWNAAGMVNAKNGFGGYVGDQPYSCDAVVSTGGNVRARAHTLELPAP